MVCYLSDHVDEYFSLRDWEDRSGVPVVFLHLKNDTAFGGAVQAGLSWFPKCIILVGFQGSLARGIGESGPLMLTHLLRHEIGHWVSLSHHSYTPESGNLKMLCSMCAFTDEFCAFCKDARARMSFISYYNSTIELMRATPNNPISEGNLTKALQLFDDWAYCTAVDDIASLYSTVELNESSSAVLVLSVIGVVVVTAVLVALLRRPLSDRIGEIPSRLRK